MIRLCVFKVLIISEIFSKLNSIRLELNNLRKLNSGEGYSEPEFFFLQIFFLRHANGLVTTVPN